MKQSRLGSFAESCINTAAGFGLSLFLQWLVLGWMLGAAVPLNINLAFAAVMTVASLARQYLLRRLFEYFRISRKLSAAMTAVIAERFRQIEAEGWTAEHDDAHETGELASAGAAYVLWATAAARGDSGILNAWRHNQVAGAPTCWPWGVEWWKPAAGDFRRNLIKADALILAEIEKLDRRRMRKRSSA